MNVIDWFVKSAEFMAADRPDLYDTPAAVQELSTYTDLLRNRDLPFDWVSFSSYVLFRTYDDGVEEFSLTRKLSSVTLFEDEDVLVFSHTTLSNAMDVGVDLPGPLDDPEGLDTDFEA